MDGDAVLQDQAHETKVDALATVAGGVSSARFFIGGKNMTAGSVRKRLLSLFLVVTLLISVCPAAFAAEVLYDNRYLISETQHTLAPGITEYVTITNNMAATDQNIDHFCEIDPQESTTMMMACYPDYDGSKYKLANVLDQAAAAQKNFDNRGLNYRVVGIINADFYNMTTGEPTGALVMEGTVYHPAGSEPYFAILNDGSAVIRDSSVPLNDVQSAVGGAMMLVRDGEIAISAADTYKVTRSAIGIKSDGTVVTMVNHGKNYPVSCGYTPYQMAEMMKARGCVSALLLDGSGSSSHATLRAGDGEILMRNEPSDGSPRHVSSSLLLVTSAAPTGVFDRADISPVNEVYTPGSQVQFTYVAVDSSNAPVDEVPTLTWQLKAGSAGSIDSATGMFAADENQTGNVTVQLVDEQGQVRGESTILVQNPDEISFETDPVSIGFGDTSDLGLTVRYEGRDVHYKDGDFTWDILPTEYTHKIKNDAGSYQAVTETAPDMMGHLNLGEVTDNQFTCLLEYTPGTDETERRASTAKATVTVTSAKAPAVSGSVTVEAGKEPSVIMDFEDHVNDDGTTTNAEGFWTIGQNGDDSGSYLVTSNYDRGGTVGAELVSRADGYPVRSGSYALKLDYSFNDPSLPNGVSGTEGACFGFRNELEIEGNPTALGMWVYVPEDTPNYWLRLQYKDGSGRVSQLDFTKQYKDAMAQDGNVGGVAPYADGTWHYFEADLTGLQVPLSIPAGMIGRLIVVPTEGNWCGKYLMDGTEVPVAEREGSIYFDDIMFIYGSNPNDTNLPEVTKFTVNDEPLAEGMVLAENELNFYAKYKDGDTLQDLGIDYDNVFLYVDGQLQNATVDRGGNYIRRDSVILADGWHSVKLLVTDLNGNERVLNYRIQVDGSSDATSVYLKQGSSPQLGQDFSLELRATNGADIQQVSLSLAVDKAYENSFQITHADGFALVGDAEYDMVNHTVEFTLQASGTPAAGDALLATLTFSIPMDLQSGTGFSYSVEKGIITYADGYTGENLGLFGSDQVRLPIEVSYQISSDVFAAGLTGTYFYIKDADGNPVPEVQLSLNGTEESIGTSDEDGKILYEPTAGGTITVQAAGSFPYTVTVNALAGDPDGAPEMILHTAVGDITTQRYISWTTNPTASGATPQLKLATDETMTNSVVYPGESQLMEFNSDQKVVRANLVQANGLIPGQTYYYQVGDGETMSEVRRFTMPSSDDALPKKILLMADIQDPDSTTPQSLLGTLNGEEYALLIQTGDLVDRGNSYEQRVAAYQQLEKVVDVERIYALGNHEKEGDGGVNTHILNQADDREYYSVLFGNLYVAVIDYGAVNEESLQWLVEDAKASDARWKFLVTHQPAYYTNAAGGNETIHDLLPQYAEEASIDLVLSGHDHSYARTKPLTGGKVDETGGITYLVCGAVGAKGYDVSGNLPFEDSFEVLKDNDDFNAIYLTLEVSQASVQVTTYNYVDDTTTTELDSFTLSCAHGDYVYDVENKQLVCNLCGAPCTDTGYTGVVSVKGSTTGEQVSLYLGNLRTGWFLDGSTWHHTGANGVLHNVTTEVTATCTEYGYRMGICNTCQAAGEPESVYRHQGNRLNPQGHKWDENHICTVCGFKGIDIATLDITLAFESIPWTGKTRWPVVTVKDGDRELVRAVSIGSGVGEYYIIYPEETEVGPVSLEIMAMDASNYYGSITKTYKIVPPQVENLQVTTMGENSVTLQWEPAHGATYYRISYYNEEQGGYYFRWQTEKTKLTIDGLEAGKDYSYRVRAYTEINGEEYAAWSSSNAVYVTPGTSDSCAENGHQYVEETVEPSCEFGGGVRYTCPVCGSSYTEISTPALGHTPVTIPGVPATCTGGGVTEGSQCSVCGEILVAPQDIAPLGHELAEAHPVDAENHSGVCSRCQETITEPHSWGDGVVVTEPTTSQTGEMRYTCTVCQNTKTESIPRLPSSGGGGGGGSATYAITVNSPTHGTVELSDRRASSGDTVTLTVTPDSGYELDALTVTDAQGNEVKVTAKGNGVYTFTMPQASITVTVTFTAQTASAMTFTDVDTGDWFYEAVKYAYGNSMMNGVGNNLFAPGSNLTRGMIAQVLYNLEGTPAAGSGAFTDVAAGQWYAEAVNWAAANDIVGGYGNGKFGPQDDVTREQMAQILYNYAAFKGYDVSVKSDLSTFNDGAKTSGWALSAMQWAVGTGLLQGYNENLNPTGTATRAEVAQILMNFCKNIAK
jgi:exopolysaccharide biosynthesis protein/predicted phosphodiesterase